MHTDQINERVATKNKNKTSVHVCTLQDILTEFFGKNKHQNMAATHKTSQLSFGSLKRQTDKLQLVN